MMILNRRLLEKVHHRAVLYKYRCYDDAPILTQLERMEDLTEGLLRLLPPFCGKHPEEKPVFPDTSDGPVCWECVEQAERSSYEYG